MWTDRPLIIDTDPGTDDAVALLVAAAEGLDVRLVVSTYGNVPHAYTKKNAVDLTGLLFPGVPVLYGADGPLSGSGHTAEYVHGENGVGGVRLRAFAPADIAQGGTDALYETVRQLGRPDYIALGPLTNLARLLAKYPQARLGRVVVMGGGLRESNMDSGAEFNFACDPQAVRAVLESGLSPQLVPLDATHQVQLTQREIASVTDLSAPPDTPRGQFAAILRYNYDMSLRLGDSGAIVHDATAVLAYRYPERFKTQSLRLEPDGLGRLTALPGAPNAAFTAGVDRAFVLERLRAAYARLD